MPFFRLLATHQGSPLTRYVRLLVGGPAVIQAALRRDASALRMLSQPADVLDDTPLERVLRRLHGLDEVRRAVARGETRWCEPRIWTRADQRFLNLSKRRTRGYPPHRQDPLPKRRANRVLRRIVIASHDLFRAALDEARHDGTANTLGPMLQKARAALKEVVDAGSEAAMFGEPDNNEFFAARQALSPIANELIFWTSPPNKPPLRGGAAVGAKESSGLNTKPGNRAAKGSPETKDVSMEKDSPLQRIDKSFLDLGTALGRLSDMLTRLQRINRDYELEFSGRHGEIISIKKRRGEPYDPADFGESDEERDLPAEVDEAHAHELREIGQFVPEFVASMLQAQRDAIAAVDSLPREILEELSALKDKPWAALVRRTCLNHVAAWPDEQLETFGGPKILDHVGYLLNEAERFDPHEKWAEYRRLLEEYRADAIAVRWYVVKAETSLACRPPETSRQETSEHSLAEQLLVAVNRLGRALEHPAADGRDDTESFLVASYFVELSLSVKELERLLNPRRLPWENRKRHNLNFTSTFASIWTVIRVTLDDIIDVHNLHPVCEGKSVALTFKVPEGSPKPKFNSNSKDAPELVAVDQLNPRVKSRWLTDLRWAIRELADFILIGRGDSGETNSGRAEPASTKCIMPTDTPNIAQSGNIDGAPRASLVEPTIGATSETLREKKKRSTSRGDARLKLIAALSKHHEYAEGGCLNSEPIGNNDLATLADVAPSTASEFFNREFNNHKKGGYDKYRVFCRDAGRLADSLKALNGEFSPHELYGRRPADEDDRDDE